MLPTSYSDIVPQSVINTHSIRQSLYLPRKDNGRIALIVSLSISISFSFSFRRPGSVGSSVGRALHRRFQGAQLVEGLEERGSSRAWHILRKVAADARVHLEERGATIGTHLIVRVIGL